MSVLDAAWAERLRLHAEGDKLWAEAMGCVGMRVESPDEVDAAIQKANEIDDRPVVIDFRTDSREKVYPMVPSGADLHAMIRRPMPSEDAI